MTPDRLLSDIVRSFSGHRVLVVGDLMLDDYLTGDCSRLSPEAPVPVLVVEGTRTVLGGAANAAHNVATLGGTAILTGFVGDDAPARQLSELARAAHVRLHPVIHAHPTTRKVRVIGQQQQLIRLDYEHRGPAAPAATQQLLEVVDAEMRDCSVVLISDYAKGTVSRALCQAIITRARATGARVIVDPRPQHSSFYPGVDFLTPNWREACALVGAGDLDPTDAHIDAVGARVAAMFGAGVLLTLGPRGMRLFDATGLRLLHAETVAKEVFDVSGAGDSVAAAFALALAAGATVSDAVQVANRAGGIAVGKLGTTPVTARDLIDAAVLDRPLVAREDLAALASSLRAAGKRIVTINGSFDLLHAGHLHILSEARRQGDVLIVGLNSDRSVRANKGPSRPYVNEHDRAALLMALRAVDYVHIFDEAVPMPFLEPIRPDVHVNGAEYGADCIEAPLVRQHGGRIHVVDRLPDLSTTGLLAKIRADHGRPATAHDA